MIQKTVLPIGVAREVVQCLLCHCLVLAYERIKRIAEKRWRKAFGQATHSIHGIGYDLGHVFRREIRMKKDHGKCQPYLAWGGGIPCARLEERVLA